MFLDRCKTYFTGCLLTYKCPYHSSQVKADSDWNETLFNVLKTKLFYNQRIFWRNSKQQKIIYRKEQNHFHYLSLIHADNTEWKYNL